ncbi:putative oxidoreductase CipA [Xylariaceae sp. AK1471]|nr:putative oxidoreductase CipA [Xylariaceae sp. AK1471]
MPHDSAKSDEHSKSKNRVKNVAIVGAGGRSGTFMVDALVHEGNHRITAITRSDSTNTIHPRFHDVKKVDFNEVPSLSKALEAVKAGVPWIMTNEWGIDCSKEELSRESRARERVNLARAYIEKVGAGKTQWIGLCYGFWYEFSLAGTEARYGFDFDKKAVTFFDDGTTKINTSTWPQVGRAIARLLSLKVFPDDDEDTSPCLSRYANKSTHVSSFFVSQRDMSESVLRITGDQSSDWKITYENVVDRYQRGQKLAQEGRLFGLGIVMYSRVFYPDGSGDFNDKLDNDVLRLPNENLDDATQVAVNMAHSGMTNAIR